MSAAPYPLNVVFASYGNDSIALIQHVADLRLSNVFVLYSDTGWAADFWRPRVERVEAWVRSLGFSPVRTKSIGMVRLVREKKGWPRQGLQFCTEELKIRPALAWLERHDPFGLARCFVGVRSEESEARQHFPELLEGSPAHGGRLRWAPLIDVKEAERNALVERAGFKVLPHRSKECFPCINSKREDLVLLAEDELRVDMIEAIETQMGFTAKGKPRTMFRPYRHMGATGIRQIVKWAKSPRGKFDPDDGTGGGNCDSGYCGL